MDYAPDSPEDESRVFGLRNLARCHYVRKEYDQACEAIRKAIEIQLRHGKVDPQDTYQQVVYLVGTGEKDEPVRLLESLCRDEPPFFAPACVDPEFEPIRNDVLRALESLAREEHGRATSKLKGIQSAFAELCADSSDKRFPEEKTNINRILEACSSLVQKRNYSDSRKALGLCDMADECLRLLRKLFDMADSKQDVVDKKNLCVSNLEQAKRIVIITQWMCWPLALLFGLVGWRLHAWIGGVLSFTAGLLLAGGIIAACEANQKRCERANTAEVCKLAQKEREIESESGKLQNAIASLTEKCVVSVGEKVSYARP